MKARIFVRLKPAILDPQGKTVQHAAHQMGYAEIKSLRMGKLIELEIDDSGGGEIRNRVEELSRRLLTNPQMETYDIEWISDDEQE